MKYNPRVFFHSIKNLMLFNNVRNIFDRYKLSEYDCDLSDGKLRFYAKNKERMANDYYARIISPKMPFGSDDDDALPTSIVWQLIAEYIKKEVNFESKKIYKPFKYDWLYLTKKVKDTFKTDFPSNVLLSDFSFIDFKNVYACLKALSIFKIAYFFKKACSNKSVHIELTPSILYPYERLISDISELCEIERVTVKRIIDLLIYEPKIHLDLINMYQPLIKIGENILYSSSIVCFSNESDKFFKLLAKKRIEEKAISQVNKNREEILTKRYIKFLTDNFSNLKAIPNAKLSINGKVKNEMDLTLIDSSSRTIFLVELKWRYKLDGEYDSFNKSKQINKDIDSRVEAEKNIKNNLSLFLSQNDINIDSGYDIKSVIVEKEFSGGASVKTIIPVCDEPLFLYSISLNNGNLKNAYDYLIKREWEKEIREIFKEKRIMPYLNYSIEVNDF